MIFWSDNFKPEFKEKFGRENTEKKFGGKLPNKKTDFWPPVLNTTNEPLQTSETVESSKKTETVVPSDEL